MRVLKNSAVAAFVSVLLGTAAQASSVAPNIIFGSGNANGSFTVSNVKTTSGGYVEIGLRAKLRYNDAGNPENTFNRDGVDTYSFAPTAGTPANRSVFNFEWHINSTATGDSIRDLFGKELYARLEYDTDPTAGTNFKSYNPFRIFREAYYGTEETPNGGGQRRFFGPVRGATVAQNSVNYGFSWLDAPDELGIYDISLSIFDANGVRLGGTAIKVTPVPVPAALPLLVFALGGLGFAGRRRKAA
nr:VPLPA-CTERM sorting domain-containing protein [uncultured Roseovarius sp.]